MSEWQPIESAPKDGTAVLAAMIWRGVVGCAAVVNWMTKADWGDEWDGRDDGWHIRDGNDRRIWYRGWPELTHWMSVPPAKA